MTDCIIVGAGPAGLSAAVTLRRRGKSVLVLSSGEGALEKAERIDNYLGMPGLSGREMMDAFRAHAAAEGAELRRAKVGNVMPFDGHFMVNADGDILEARSVILACGGSRGKPVPGESELLGHGVSYCATCDGMLYRGRAVLVWGLASDAAHEANFLDEIGCRVTFVAAGRPDDLAPGITFVQGRVRAVTGETAVTGADTDAGHIDAACVFVLRASTPPAVLLEGLALAGDAVDVDRACATNVPGVFAAGDMAGRPLQVAKAVGDGLTAALSAVQYLDKKPAAAQN